MERLSVRSISGLCSGIIGQKESHKCLIGGKDGSAHMVSESGEIETIKMYDSSNAINCVSICPNTSEFAFIEERKVRFAQLPDIASSKKETTVTLKHTPAHISYDIRGDLILASFSDALNVEVYSISSGELVHTIPCGTEPVRSFVLHGSGRYLATLNSSGSVMIHRTFLDNRRIGVSVLEDHHAPLLCAAAVAADADGSRKLRMAWDPTEGSYKLYVPGTAEGGVGVLQYNNEDKCWTSYSLPMTDFAGAITAIAPSPDGTLLACSDITNRCTIVGANGEQVFRRMQMPESMTASVLGMHWLSMECDGAMKTSLVVASKDGIARVAVPSDMAPLASMSNSDSSSSRSSSSSSSRSGRGDDISSSSSGNKSNIKVLGSGLAGSKIMNDDDDDDDIDFSADDATRPVNRNIEAVVAAERERRPDVARRRATEMNIATAMDTEEQQLDLVVADMEDIADYNIPEVSVQGPFMPTQSDPDESDMSFLSWNLTGMVRVVREVPQLRCNHLDVRFTNSLAGNVYVMEGGQRTSLATGTFHFQDFRFVKADMNEQGVILTTEATAPKDNDDTNYQKGRGSTLFYRAFGKSQQRVGTQDAKTAGLGCSDTFVKRLPAGEAAVAVAIGDKWIAVATTERFLRIFSTCGVELAVLRAGGPVVSMCGEGAQLAVFYHASAPIDGTENMAVDMLCVGSDSTSPPRLIGSSPVHLSPGSRLRWVGFDTETGVLCMIDTDGMMSGLLKACGWVWLPILDRIVGAMDCVWPIAVKAEKLYLVHLKENEEAPNCRSPPIVESIALNPGLAGGNYGAAERALWEGAKARHWAALHSDRESFGEGLPESVDLAARCRAQQEVADRSTISLVKNVCRGQKLNFDQAGDLVKRLFTVAWAEKAAKLFALYAENSGASRNSSMSRDNTFVEGMYDLQSMAEKHADKLRARPGYENSQASSATTSASSGFGLAGTVGAMAPTVDAPQGGMFLGVNPPLRRSYSAEMMGLGKLGMRSMAAGKAAAVVEAPPNGAAKRKNPFKKVVQSPEKKHKSIFETIKSLKNSPSPARKKTKKVAAGATGTRLTFLK